MATESRTNDLDVDVPGADGMDADGMEDAPPVVPARYAMVETLLHQIPQEFDFFQAVRLFERMLPGGAPVGGFSAPSKEVLRFRAHASFPFPASQIQQVDWPEAGTSANPKARPISGEKVIRIPATYQTGRATSTKLE